MLILQVISCKRADFAVTLVLRSELFVYVLIHYYTSKDNNKQLLSFCRVIPFLFFFLIILHRV